MSTHDRELLDCGRTRSLRKWRKRMTKPFGTDIPSSTSAGLRTAETLDEASRVMQAQQAEIERLRAELERKSDTAVRNKWMAEVMQEEVKRLRADAERYRWLRDPANAYADEWNLFGPYSSPKEIDAAIDAAMKEAK